MVDLTWVFFDLSSVHVTAILLTVAYWIVAGFGTFLENGFHTLEEKEKPYARAMILRLRAVEFLLVGPMYYGVHAFGVWLGMAFYEDLPLMDAVSLLVISHAGLARVAYQFATFNAMTPPDVVTVWVIQGLSVLFMSVFMSLEAVALLVKHDVIHKQLYLKFFGGQ
jgi:hypothetical protein